MNFCPARHQFGAQISLNSISLEGESWGSPVRPTQGSACLSKSVGLGKLRSRSYGWPSVAAEWLLNGRTCEYERIRERERVSKNELA